jgi:hypothetical protein
MTHSCTVHMALQCFVQKNLHVLPFSAICNILLSGSLDTFKSWSSFSDSLKSTAGRSLQLKKRIFKKMRKPNLKECYVNNTHSCICYLHNKASCDASEKNILSPNVYQTGVKINLAGWMKRTVWTQSIIRFSNWQRIINDAQHFAMGAIF